MDAALLPAAWDDVGFCGDQHSYLEKVIETGIQQVPEGLTLERRADGLTLSDGKLALVGDFGRKRDRLRQNNLAHELLVRAAKIKGVAHPLVCDATAGLGEDSLLLAAAGANVVLFERDPVCAALLADTLLRAREDETLLAVARRMWLAAASSEEYLGELGFEVDVVVLDPMFPARAKAAAVKKKLQLIQKLEAPEDDEGGLLAAARSSCPRKIVIKRPAKGPYLAGCKPSYTIAGKAVRYDCIALAPRSES